MKQTLLVILLSLGVGAAIRPAAAEFSLPVKPDATIWKYSYKVEADWDNRVMVESFRKIAMTGNPWDAEALTFVQEAVKVFLSPKSDITALLVSGRKLIDAGCDDPVVLYLWACLEKRKAPADPQIPLVLAKAVRQLEAKPYPRGFARIVAYASAYTAHEVHQPWEQADAQAASWTLESWKDGSYGPNEDILFVEHGFSPMGRSQLDRCTAQMLDIYTKCGAPEWAKQALIGETEVVLAWKERGSDFAAETSDEQFAGFGKHLALARTALLKSWQLRPDRPQAATAMIDVVMGGAGNAHETVFDWLTRAVQAQFDYAPAYTATLCALQAKWGGTREEVIAFGRACLATKRYDTFVPGLYMDALDQLVKEGLSTRAIYRDPDLGPGFITLFQEAIAARPKEKSTWQPMLAVSAWLIGTNEVAVQAWKDCNGLLTPRARNRLTAAGESESHMRDDMEVLTTPAQKNYLRGLAQWEAHDPGDALPLFEAAEAQIPSENKTAVARVHRFVVGCKLEEAIDKGDWVKLPIESIQDWEPHAGTWIVTNNAFEATTGGNFVQLNSQVRVPRDFEVRGEFEETPATNQHWGFMVGRRPGFAAPALELTFTEKRRKNGPQTQLLQPDQLDNGLGQPVSLKDHNQFLAQCWNGKFSMYLNDAPIVTNFALKASGESLADQFLILGPIHISKGEVCRIRNVEVRRLHSPPTAPKPDAHSQK